MNMDEKELRSIVADIQASPAECEWVEIKHNNEDPEAIGEYVSALANGAAYMGQSKGYILVEMPIPHRWCMSRMIPVRGCFTTSAETILGV